MTFATVSLLDIRVMRRLVRDTVAGVLVAFCLAGISKRRPARHELSTV